jgi:uncharacterized membrane protein YheB (UPF0754 family)
MSTNSAVKPVLFNIFVPIFGDKQKKNTRKQVMTFSASIIIAPIVGSIIGCFINYLFIRMLFCSYTAKCVFGIHIPFTPRIIPVEKGRVAKAIGGVISENLMNHEVLKQYRKENKL